MPAVTVVVPLFQTERYIGETLASVLAQSFADFEVIVVDDGSTDRGPAIARTTGDARIRVVTQRNRGLAGARNTGIRNASGRYIALLDADDRWHPDKLARHVAHLDANPSVGVSFSHSRLIDETGASLGLVQTPSGRALTADEHFCNNPIGNGSAPVLRKAVLDAVGFTHADRGDTCWFDEDFRQSEDVECWVRIATTTPWAFACIDQPLTDYRVNAAGLSANVDKQLASWRRFRDKLALYAPDLVQRAGARAEAYQHRVLARRAVSSGEAAVGLRMITTALRLHPAMLREEPARTLVTLGAAVVGLVMPRSVFELARRAAVHLAGLSPRLRV